MCSHNYIIYFYLTRIVHRQQRENTLLYIMSKYTLACTTTQLFTVKKADIKLAAIPYCVIITILGNVEIFFSSFSSNYSSQCPQLQIRIIMSSYCLQLADLLQEYFYLGMYGNNTLSLSLPM